MTEGETPPGANNPTVREEIEKLHARIRELEAQVRDLETRQQRSGAAPGNILYEKERIGYVFRADELEPAPSVSLPDVDPQKVLQAPLVETGKPIGTMIVEPPPDREISPEEARLAEAIAQQASLQIQNLRLLAAAERARAEALAASRQFTHQSWESFLDAIQNSERIGFEYDQNAVTTYVAPSPADADFHTSVSVLEEQIGRLYLKSDPQRPISEEDKALAESVARQVAQQVENLRLLADASRARAEAEEATRRLTRDSWQGYVERQEDHLAFVYDSNQVTPLATHPDNVRVSQPLIVRGEPIGQLAIADEAQVSPEAYQLLVAIANQASIHLETLRLNEELQQRAQELQELDRLKSSFLANMSHELRTPLNSILGFSDVMLEGIDGPLTEYMENDLRLIQKNGQHLLSLINDILDMAKIESGRMNLHPENFKLYDLVQDVFKITSSLANAKELALFVEPDSEIDTVIYADNIRMRQVMINLVNNAIKFTESGSISIRITRIPNEKALITVKDTGLGIPEDHLEKIFQEFSQVDTSTTRKAGGTGLGLPISRKLVQMHGGRLWAESRGLPGEGSTFFVEMPLIAQITEPIEKRTK